MTSDNSCDSGRTEGGETDSGQSPTRRRTLQLLSAVGVGSFAIPAVNAAEQTENRRETGRRERGSPQFPRRSSGLDDDWWREPGSSKSAYEVVREGTSEYVTDDREAPDWFTIGESDELEYKPQGVYRKLTDGDTGTRSIGTGRVTAAQSPAASALCLPTKVSIAGTEVGFKACHYGGCEWTVEVCAVGCIGTGIQDDCDSGDSLTGGLGGRLNLDVWIDPDATPLVSYSTAMVLTDLAVEGTLCHYRFIGKQCFSVDHTFDFPFDQ